jgi:hypothetical protein
MFEEEYRTVGKDADYAFRECRGSILKEDSMQRTILKLAFAAALLAVPAIGAQADEKSDYRLYVGTVTDKPDEFVGVAVLGKDATIYICDGQPDKGSVRIAEWFIDTVAENKIEKTGKTGNKVEVVLTDASADGHFTFKDGSIKRFNLSRGEETTALYRAEFAFGNQHYVGGWLVLADGSVRGAVLNVEKHKLVPSDIDAYPGLVAPKKP